MSRQIRMQNLKWLRWVSPGKVRVRCLLLDRPTEHQDIQGEMQYRGELMIKWWT